MDKMVSPSELLEMYKKWVINKPNVVTDVETVTTWSLYFAAGKINKSPIASEFVYTLSKLVSLYNDKLIREAYGSDVQYYGLREQLKLWLSVIHYCEVFVELVIKHKYGSRVKWSVATVLQMFKCSSALILLYRYKEVPISHPPIPMLQRKKFIEGKKTDENPNAFFTLRRSGRVMRKVEGAPSVSFRDWQPIKIKDETPNSSVNVNELMYAETLHLLKPLIHLASMRLFGTKAWKQWLITLGMDLASIKLYNYQLNNLSYEHRIEISRRKVGLVLYLLRSPMYNVYSKNIIEGILNTLIKRVPLATFICGPITQYLSHWQDVYFYMWAS